MCTGTPQSQELASESKGVGSTDPSESFVRPGSIFFGPAVMMMHQETTVPGELIAWCKDAGISLLHGD